MTVLIDDPELEVAVQRLAEACGKPVEEVVRMSLKLAVEQQGEPTPRKKDMPGVDEVLRLIASFPVSPVSYNRSDDEILGYGPNGYCE